MNTFDLDSLQETTKNSLLESVNNTKISKVEMVSNYSNKKRSIKIDFEDKHGNDKTLTIDHSIADVWNQPIYSNDDYKAILDRGYEETVIGQDPMKITGSPNGYWWSKKATPTIGNGTACSGYYIKPKYLPTDCYVT